MMDIIDIFVISVAIQIIFCRSWIGEGGCMEMKKVKVCIICRLNNDQIIVKTGDWMYVWSQEVSIVKGCLLFVCRFFNSWFFRSVTCKNFFASILFVLWLTGGVRLTVYFFVPQRSSTCISKKSHQYS